MPVNNSVAASAEEIASWRQDLHRHPELQYDLPRTSAFVAEKLRAFGCDEVVEGIGRTGVVGIVHGAKAGRMIGLRADMDALPIVEDTGAAYASQTPGRMHACGHDGHTAMLLGAARHLAENRAFAGSVALIFQPAEEGGAGAFAMVKDGLFDRFPTEEVYGMHNMPGMAVGTFGMRSGAIMASTDRIEITIEGRGAHAAMPHQGVDVVLAGSSIVTALQQITARNVNPLQSAVVSITMFHAGEVDNVLPPRAQLTGTLRTLDKEVRAFAMQRIREVAEGVATAYGATAMVSLIEGYPVTRNHADQTRFAAEVAQDVAGQGQVNVDVAPLMGAEDFAFMLDEKPGAYIFLGNGDTAGLHHPRYDFSDAAIPFGVSYWVRLVERALPL